MRVRRRVCAVSLHWSALDLGILGPALLAGLLVLATHVPLGAQVLDRGIVFIDLAIAQIAGLGVIADGSELGGPHPETHHTIYASAAMTPADFKAHFSGLPWTYVGKKK